jgi:class 3 adenylate cyclase
MSEIRDLRSNATPRQSIPCRLAAVVVGDISGRAFPTPTNGEETHRRIKRIERELVEPSVLQHHGRLAKTTTDGFVAIFDNPVEAARCSVIIRQGIVERNQSLPAQPWIEYRIGVNLGDVVTDPNDIYGDGVYAASGLAAIAGPGQVCISGGVYEQIKQKLFYGYESLGDRKVENTAGPVTVYRMHPEPDAFHKIGRRREIILILLLSLTLLVIAGGLWSLLGQPHRRAVAAEGAGILAACCLRTIARGHGNSARASEEASARLSASGGSSAWSGGRFA